MSFLNPTIDEFKSFFVRNFPYGTDPATSVLDQDIANSYLMTNINFNPCFWADQNAYTLGYLYLSAHFLITNLQTSGQGIGAQFDWNATSKSVGSVSEGMQIPKQIMENPEYAMLTKTPYGAQYLFWILPQLTGQIFNAFGTTLP